MRESVITWTGEGDGGHWPQGKTQVYNPSSHRSPWLGLCVYGSSMYHLTQTDVPTGNGLTLIRQTKSRVHWTFTCLWQLARAPSTKGKRTRGSVVGRGISNAVPGGMVKGEDSQVAKIHPVILKEMMPLALNTLHGCACIELHAKSIMHDMKVCREVCEGGFVCLERVHVLMHGN